MFVMLVTYFVIIKRVLRKNHMKNKMILLMMMIVVMIMLIYMKKILVSSLMSNWRCKRHCTQTQNGMSFHHIHKEYKHMI